MTCYMRHMDWLFEALEVPSDRANRRAVDTALQDLLHVGDDAHCPEVWAAIKALSDAERAALIPRVAEALSR